MSHPRWMVGLDEYHAEYPENGDLLVIAEGLQAELEARFPDLSFKILKLQAPGWEVRIFKAVTWAGNFVKGMLKVTRDGLRIMIDDEGFTRQHTQIDYGDPKLVDLVVDWITKRCDSSVGRASA